MIHFISRYLQQLHFERDHWLTRAERRRAIKLFLVLVALVSLSVILWVAYK